jgi:hypothetical protein
MDISCILAMSDSIAVVIFTVGNGIGDYIDSIC